MARLEEAHISFLKKHFKSIENGKITITIHDGVISRIEKEEHALLDESYKTSLKNLVYP